MRLYLSSYGLGNNPEKLVKLVGTNARVAVIANVCDAQDVVARSERVEREIVAMKGLGFSAREIDLRDYFGRHITEKDLKEFDLLWLRGGNVFVLRAAMKLSGFDTYIKKALNDDSIIYGGFSAACCVLAPSLEGFDIVDNPKEVEIAYSMPADYRALGILPYSIEPHFKSDHPESADIDKELVYLKLHKIPFKTLRDGEVIVIDGDSEELVV